MNKHAFLAELRKGLKGLPQESIEEHISFYSEMIEDRVEDGISEEEAVLEIGSVEDIVSQITAEDGINKKVKPRKWNFSLLIIGSPLWLILAVVIFALFIVLFSLLIALWAVEFSLLASALGTFVSFFVYIFGENPLIGVGMLGIAAFIFGASIYLFFACCRNSYFIIPYPKPTA